MCVWCYCRDNYTTGGKSAGCHRRLNKQEASGVPGRELYAAASAPGDEHRPQASGLRCTDGPALHAQFVRADENRPAPLQSPQGGRSALFRRGKAAHRQAAGHAPVVPRPPGCRAALLFVRAGVVCGRGSGCAFRGAALRVALRAVVCRCCARSPTRGTPCIAVVHGLLGVTRIRM